MMTSLAFNEIARAMATSCWIAVGQVPKGALTSTSIPKRDRMARVRRCASPHLINPPQPRGS